jgi:hypothetical protein
MKALFSLRGADFDEMRVGVASVVRTLGPAAATGAILFATRRHLAALARGEGSYPEPGKRRIWFKLHYLSRICEYLRKKREGDAVELFGSILEGPTLRFIGHVIPPSECLTRDYVLHQLWPEMIDRDYNIEAEACSPSGTSVSLKVRRCFINEVARDVGLMPVADRICSGDFRFWEGYHPRLRFSRTQTLLAGDPLCDHTLTWLDQTGVDEGSNHINRLESIEAVSQESEV